MSRKKFYEIVPQMETYDNLGYEWVPFMMFSEPLNFRSKVVNTDINGLDLIISQIVIKKVFLIIMKTKTKI